MSRRLALTVCLFALLAPACSLDTVVAVEKRASAAGDSGSPTTGFLHTSGSRILDADGRPVRLTGVSWFGLETPNFVPHGLWARPLASFLDQIRDLGFNCVRVPVSSELLDPGSVPNGFDANQNPDLGGLDGLGVLERVVKEAGSRGLKVILDRHRPDAGSQSALWYTDRYPEDRWIADLRLLSARYRGNPTVVGFELHNDLRDPATWGDGNATTDWRAAAERGGNAILGVNPDVLVIVEGVETVNGERYFRGGNLRGAEAAPVRLTVPGRLVYGTQDYPPSVEDHPWFHDAAYPGNLPSVWDAAWGSLVERDVAPVLLVGFGTRNDADADRQWFRTIADYIGTRELGFTYWALNPDSGDTGGILEDDWATVRDDKMDVLRPLLAPPL